MANAIYAKALEAFGNGDISWRDDAFVAILVDTDVYAVDLANHDFLADIPSGARLAVSADLTGKTNVGGVLDADDAAFTGITVTDAEVAVLVQKVGALVESTSRLVAFLDTVSGLPLSITGGDATLRWSNGADKILKL